MYIETDLTRINSKEEIDLSIERMTDALEKLKAHQAALEGAEDLKPKYVGKYFIQNMYETGTRYMYVLDCAIKDGDLAFLAYGAQWDEQGKVLRFISPNFPIWLEDVLYGELEEVDLKGLKQAIQECINWELENGDLWWRNVGSN